MKQVYLIRREGLAGELDSKQRFRPYLGYRESAPGALGPIPSHWTVKRLKHVVGKIGSGKTPKGGAERYVSEGVMLLRSQNIHDNGLRLDDVVFIDGETDAEMASTRIEPRDVLLNITGASIGRCSLVPVDTPPGNVNQHVCIIRPTTISPAFLHSVLCSKEIKDWIRAAENGTSREGLNFQQVADMIIPVPPLDEQRAIAAFLDRETARIDELIAKKQRLIELLAEKRTALITHAVTGEIVVSEDATWREMQLGRAIKLQRGFDITGASNADGSVPVISSGGFSGFCNVPMVAGPGVIVGRKGTLGTVHFVETDYWPHDTTLWVKQFRGNYARFVYHFLIHMALERFDVGAANPTVNRNHVHPVTVLWPDEPTQRHIAAFLDEQTEHISALSLQIDQAVTRLREYRSALVSAAVTGIIDVRRETAI